MLRSCSVVLFIMLLTGCDGNDTSSNIGRGIVTGVAAGVASAATHHAINHAVNKFKSRRMFIRRR